VEKRESVRFRIPRLREGRLFETRSGGALLRMKSVISKAHLTLKEAPFETPPAAAPQDRRAVSKGVDTGKAHFFRTLLV